MRPARRASGMASLLPLLMAGCGLVKGALQFREPEIALERIEITGLSLTGGTFDLILDVYNPNPYELRGTRIELGLDLEGTHFGDALVERPVALSQENHSRIVVPVRFEWAGISAAAQALVTRQSVRYRLGGAVLVDTPLGDRRVRVTREGDVPLTKLSP